MHAVKREGICLYRFYRSSFNERHNCVDPIKPGLLMFNSDVRWICIYIYIKDVNARLITIFARFLEEKGLLLPNDPLTYAPFVPPSVLLPLPFGLCYRSCIFYCALSAASIYVATSFVIGVIISKEKAKCQGKYGSNLISNYSLYSLTAPSSRSFFFPASPT